MDTRHRTTFLAGLGAGVVATFAFVSMTGLAPRGGGRADADKAEGGEGGGGKGKGKGRDEDG
jgi:hypothetical protein